MGLFLATASRPNALIFSSLGHIRRAGWKTVGPNQNAGIPKRAGMVPAEYAPIWAKCHADGPLALYFDRRQKALFTIVSCLAIRLLCWFGGLNHRWAKKRCLLSAGQYADCNSGESYAINLQTIGCIDLCGAHSVPF